MNFRLTVILLALVLVFGLVLLGVTLLDDTPSATDLVLESLAGAKADQIDAVEIERGPPAGGTLKIVRAGKDKWEIVEPFKARADRFAVEGVIGDLLRAKPVASPEVTSNLAFHGLEPPGLRVTLRQGDRAETVNLGNVTVGGDKGLVFVTTSTRPKRAMAVRPTDLSSLFRTPGDRAGGNAGDLAKWAAHYRAKPLFGPGTGADEAEQLKVAAGKSGFTLTRHKDGWTFADPAGMGEADAGGSTDPKDAGKFTGVRPLLNALTGLQATTADDFIESPGDLKPYGLEPGNPDAVRVEIKPKDGPPDVVFVGKKVEGQPGRVFARVEGEAGVVRAQAPPDLAGLPGVAANPGQLRDRTLIDAEKTRITAVDVTAGGQTVKLRKVGTAPVWTLYGGSGDPQPAGAAAADALVNALVGKRNIKDFPAASDANFAGPARRGEVRVWLDGIDATPADPKADPKAEPKLKGEPIVLTLGGALADGVFVRRAAPGKPPLDVLMPEAFAAAVAKTHLDLLDPALKSFATNAATRVAFNRGAEPFELVKDEPKKDEKPESAGPAAWTFAKPDRLKGGLANPAAIQDALLLLATGSATKFVDEQPTPEALAKLGLDPKGPRMRVTVTVPDGDEKERVYDFGNDADDKGLVYARVGGRPAVFLMSRLAFDRFATADFRDTTVLKLDTAKVTGVKLNGWAEATGSPFTLDLEKKGDTWVAKAPAGYEVNPLKVTQLLKSLDGLRAKTRAPELKPEHGFDVAKGKGLEITLGTAAGPVALNFGAETDGGASYFVWLSTSPKEAVTVDAAPFKEFKANPKVFQKGK